MFSFFYLLRVVSSRPIDLCSGPYDWTCTHLTTPVSLVLCRVAEGTPSNESCHLSFKLVVAAVTKEFTFISCCYHKFTRKHVLYHMSHILQLNVGLVRQRCPLQVNRRSFTSRLLTLVWNLLNLNSIPDHVRTSFPFPVHVVPSPTSIHYVNAGDVGQQVYQG